MARIIAFANQKGGVGKTTSAVNLAASVGVLKKKVLMVDLDPQGNTTSGFGISKKSLKYSSYDVLIGKCTAADAVVKTKFDKGFKRLQILCKLTEYNYKFSLLFFVLHSINCFRE